MNKMIPTKSNGIELLLEKNEKGWQLNSIMTQHTNNEFDVISTNIKPITMPC